MEPVSSNHYPLYNLYAKVQGHRTKPRSISIICCPLNSNLRWFVRVCVDWHWLSVLDESPSAGSFPKRVGAHHGEELISVDHISELQRSSGLDAGQACLVSNQPEQILSDVSFFHLIPETGLCPPLV